MVLKDVQCSKEGCAGEVQFTIDSDKEITNVGSGGIISIPSQKDKCPECGSTVAIYTEYK